MLSLTETATTVIRSIVGSSEPDTGGLRIASTNDGQESFTVATASEPIEGDQVVEESGARVFLEPGAALLLDDKVLDARVDEKGGVQFLLVVQ
jgi:Fe-S cluster assembly iron-binding protein IscA